jgi:hypothetical protein
MIVDRWLRFAAAAALPVLGVTAWVLRTDPPPARTQPIAAPAPNPRLSEPSADGQVSGRRPSAGLPDGVAARGEKALARGTKQPTPPPEHAAATLPPADEARPPSRVADRTAARGPCGGLEARLISLGDDPEWTFASIAPAPFEPARISRVGDRIGAWRVAAIDWDRVWIQSGGPRCALKLHEGLREGAEAAGGLDAQSDRAPPWQVPEAIAEAIEKRSETEFRLTRSGLSAIFETRGALLSGVRLVPVKKAEHELAIQLEYVPLDSLLERLGLQSGDLLVSLNGARCVTPAAALDALTRARESDRLVARLERNGESFEIEISVQPQRSL